MLFLALLIVFLAVGAMLWFQGLWNCGLALVNILFAGLIATNCFEPISAAVANSQPSFTYLVDCLVFWGVFALSYTILRIITDLISKERVKFDMPVEMAGRSILAIWAAWLVVSYTALSLHMAPIQAQPFGGAFSGPYAGSFLGMAPERNWLGFVQQCSRGVFSTSGSISSPYESDSGLQVFDPQSEFLIKYHQRRQNFEAEPEFRVN